MFSSSFSSSSAAAAALKRKTEKERQKKRLKRGKREEREEKRLLLIPVSPFFSLVRFEQSAESKRKHLSISQVIKNPISSKCYVEICKQNI